MTPRSTPRSSLVLRRGLAPVALLLALPFLSACAEDAAGTDIPQERVLRVEVAPVAAVDSYAIERSYVGQVEAKRRSQVGFDLPGTLVRALVDEGDRVRAGQTLARLDVDRLNARRNELDAALVQAETSRDLALSTLERIRRAAERNAVSAQDVDEAQQRATSADAALARIRAQIELLDVDLTNSTLKSPYAAIVSARLLDEGQVLAAGTPVFELVESAAPRVRIGVGPDVARGLAETAAQTLEIGDQTYEGKLLQVLPEQDARTRTVDLLFELDTTLGVLKVGESATLRSAREVSAKGYWLPISALTESLRGLWSCYVATPVEADGEATHALEKRQLEALEIDSEPTSGEPRAFVRGALADGELVVQGGLQRLTNGQRVRVESANASTGEAR
ncbi:MAG: efflux RND transporter periplasmic adaptor subunit [Acidobacteriota bacterium]